MFSIGASKIANSARENVSRYGNIAGQKVVHTIWLPILILIDFPKLDHDHFDQSKLTANQIILCCLILLYFNFFLFVLFYFIHFCCHKVKDGAIFEDVSSSVTNIASKVWIFI